MTALALLAVGLYDLARSLAPAAWSPGRAGRTALGAAVVGVLLGSAALAVVGPPWTSVAGAVLVACGALLAWGATGAERPRVLLGVVAALGLVGVLELGLGAPEHRFAPAGLTMVAVAVALAETANRITRAVLQLAGRRTGESDAAPAAEAEPPLRGGRYIGPMERVLMVLLGLAHAWQVIAALMAAKGIVRFPEISADRGDGSRAEEFLVGSLASWGLAAVGGLLVWLSLGSPPFPAGG